MRLMRISEKQSFREKYKKRLVSNDAAFPCSRLMALKRMGIVKDYEVSVCLREDSCVFPPLPWPHSGDALICALFLPAENPYFHSCDSRRGGSWQCDC